MWKWHKVMTLFVALFLYVLELTSFSFEMFSVGPNSMPCQLMVGFFAYAKSLEINIDKTELEGIFNDFQEMK